MPGTQIGTATGGALSWIPLVVSALVVAHLFALVGSPHWIAHFIPGLLMK